MTLYSSLLRHCDAGNTQRFVFPDEGLVLSASQLLSKADVIAAGLQSLALPESSIVLLCSHNSSTLVATFLATQKAGLVPCIIAPKEHDDSAFKSRLLQCFIKASPSAVFLDDAHGPAELEEVRKEMAATGAPQPVCIENFAWIPLDCPSRVSREAPLSFVQFTSGSVLNPRGVMISHTNVEANCNGMAKTHGWSSSDVCVCWLPLYHDMGLVGHLAPSCLVGWSIVLIDPMRFVRNPSRWLRLISEYGGTASGAPNFAYALCANRIPDSHLEGIDLTSWRHAYNGSEPIRRKDVEAFVERYSPYGFSSRTIKNVYGLAETTLAATFPSDESNFSYLTADPDHLASNKCFRPATPNDGGLDIVSVGRPLPGHELRIIDQESGAECSDGQIGEIQLRGPSIMVDYVGGDAPICDGWLRSGDMGFCWKGDLYVTGRIKDIIKKGGKNIFAPDVEALCIRIRGIRFAAAFEFCASSRTQLGIALEVDSRGEAATDQIIHEIRKNVLNTLRVSIDSIWMVPRHSIPRTTSGKIQRPRTAQIALSGVWGAPHNQAHTEA